MIEVIEKDLLTVTPEFAGGSVIIAHQVNCQGVMGSGVALGVKRKFPNAFLRYVDWCNGMFDKERLLGQAQVVPIGDFHQGRSNAYVANIFGQVHYARKGEAPTRYTCYGAVADAMLSLVTQMEERSQRPKLFVPYLMGCDRGGADWEAYSTILRLGYTLNDVVACKLPAKTS